MKKKQKRQPSPKLDLFCITYLKTGCNATAAARVAFPASISEMKGFQMMQNPRVLERIAELKPMVDRELTMDAAQTLKHVSDVLAADTGDLFDDNGNLIPIRNLPPHVRRAVEGVEVTEQRKVVISPEGAETVIELRTVLKKVKLSPRLTAADQMNRYHGNYERDNVQRSKFALLTDDEIKSQIQRMARALGINAADAGSPGAQGEGQPSSVH